MGGRRFVLAAAVAIVVVLGTIAIVTINASSSAAKFASDPATIASCIKLGPDGTQRFDTRHAVVGASRMGDALSGLAYANQNEVSGVAMCSNDSGVFISVHNPSAALLTAIAQIHQGYPRAKVVIAKVVAGLTSQLAAQRRLGALMPRDGLVGIWPNIYTGGLGVAVLDSHWPVSAALRRRVEAAATGDGAVTMPVDFHIGTMLTAANS
jgi:hypothetical protein